MKKFVFSILLLLLAFVIFYIYWDKRSKWDAQRIYHEYNSAVCLLHAKYGYKVIVEDKDYTKMFFEIAGGSAAETIKSYEELDDGTVNMGSGLIESTGTAFFIREDGILATCLHVIHPWLYDNEPDYLKRLEEIVKTIFRNKANEDDTINTYIANKLKVIGFFDSLWIVPNGVRDCAENGYPCKLLTGDQSLDFYEKPTKLSYNHNMDATIIQTISETLPPFVERIIKLDILSEWFEYDSKSNIADSRIGEMVFAIGYPYGISNATVIEEDKDSLLSSQIQNGIITQYRGLHAFGHNIPSAPGMSGAPIINNKGQLVGLHTSGYTGTTGVQGINQGTSASILSNNLSEWDSYKRDLIIKEK